VIWKVSVSIQTPFSFIKLPEENHRLREQISSMKEVSVKLENVTKYWLVVKK